MSGPPTYRIEKIADFLNVPEDRLPICLHEFGSWVAAAGAFKDSGLEPYVIGESPLTHFTWIDDGKLECRITVRDETGHPMIAETIDLSPKEKN